MSSKLAPALALAILAGVSAAQADARPHHRPAALHHARLSQRVAFMGYLRDARQVTVYDDGHAVVAAPRAPAPATPRDRLKALLRGSHQPTMPPVQLRLDLARYGPLRGDVPKSVRNRILFDIDHPPQRYAPDRVIVLFKPGVTAAQDRAALTPAAAAGLRRAVLSKRSDVTPHPFTSDARTNRALMQLGADRVDRLIAGVDRAALGAMRGRAEARLHRSVAPFENAFVVHLGAASVPHAVRALRTLSSVALVEPDLVGSSMSAGYRPVPAESLRELAGFRRSTNVFGRAVRSTGPSFVPSNAAVAFNVQAMLDAPGVDAIAAFDEIGQRFGELPGTGEIITNIGYGDVYDAAVAANPNDPCYNDALYAGPTTRLVGGQHYLDLPSMPLIPVWVADSSGVLSGSATVCGIDPTLAEVALDFSVMAPLPHDRQRAGEIGAAGTDLLGIAPGASYRWVAPQTATISDTLAAMIAAARQQPAPNVITASIGFGSDAWGFPGRYLEDDPIAHSVVASIVSSNIVVCIAANDGTRTFTSAAVGPSGGAAPTNVGSSGTTTIGDVFYTTVPSVVPDSGAIAVGATTLDDIFSANPLDPASGKLAGVPTFAETRYNGMMQFASGFGSRVNVSAPGDNIEALLHVGPSHDSVISVLNGGTSASAPEVAAAAAVALQVGRLTGHPFQNALQVRDTLAATGTPVATPPQSDVAVNVGPQISVRRLVESLLATAGKSVAPGVARVAVHGRRSGSFMAQLDTQLTFDGTFVTALDPSYIKLDGPFAQFDQLTAFPGSDTAADMNSYITLAPDWESIPVNATYRLTVAGQPSRVIATTPFVRLLPAQLFAAAGVPFTPGASKTIALTYSAIVGLHPVAQTTFQLTFGPPAATSRLVLAPRVPPVVSGATIPVTYDFRGYPPGLLNNPSLKVSMPGTGTLHATYIAYPAYSVPLSAPSGTVDVPVSALAGAGTYTIWIDLGAGGLPNRFDYSDFAYVRVDAGTARPPAPRLTVRSDDPGTHNVGVPYKSSFTVSYDVSSVAGATGAIVEVSAPAPGPSYFDTLYPVRFNTFRNPNGSELDDDGLSTGSVYHVAAQGTHGSVTIDPVAAKLPYTTTMNVRVLATSGGIPIGEASDAGIVGLLGIESALGVPLGFVEMNPHGADGYLGEYAGLGTPTGNFGFYTAEPFDLSAGTVSSIAYTSTSANTSFSPVLQDDAAVIYTTPDGGTNTFLRADPLAAGFSSFVFPPGGVPPTAFLFSAAENSSPTRSAFLAYDFATSAYLMTR
ncbi:MAG TPA: S8 family serine peptidase, partial [Candidatus Elarobacter sp.]